MYNNARIYLLLISTLIFLAGCSSTEEEYDPTADWSVEQLYEEASEHLAYARYEVAIEYFEKIEARFPFGPLAQQAQLDVAYAYFKFEENASALAAADRFIRIHPTHKNVDYAYYLKGLINFKLGIESADQLFDQDPAERDPGATRQAFLEFRTLTERYPNSRYAEDARSRMHLLRDNLARHEVQVADYYMRRNAYLGAAKRANYVIQNFAPTPSLPDALALLVRAYRAMEIDDLANDALQVLKLNYPEYATLPELEAQAGMKQVDS